MIFFFKALCCYSNVSTYHSPQRINQLNPFMTNTKLQPDYWSLIGVIDYIDPLAEPQTVFSMVMFKHCYLNSYYRLLGLGYFSTKREATKAPQHYVTAHCRGYMGKVPILTIQCASDVIFRLKFNGAFPLKAQPETSKRQKKKLLKQ